MNITTNSTVGFGDYTPTNKTLRIFMIVYSIIGIGLYGHSAGHTASHIEQNDRWIKENKKDVNLYDVKNWIKFLDWFVLSIVVVFLAGSYLMIEKGAKMIDAGHDLKHIMKAPTSLQVTDRVYSIWEILTTVG